MTPYPPLRRYVLIALWGIAVGVHGFIPDLPWRPLWLAWSIPWLCGTVAYAYRQGKREAVAR